MLETAIRVIIEIVAIMAMKEDGGTKQKMKYHPGLEMMMHNDAANRMNVQAFRTEAKVRKITNVQKNASVKM